MDRLLVLDRDPDGTGSAITILLLGAELVRMLGAGHQTDDAEVRLAGADVARVIARLFACVAGPAGYATELHGHTAERVGQLVGHDAGGVRAVAESLSALYLAEGPGMVYGAIAAIEALSSGRVRRPEGNRRTGMPERDGPFCARILGPTEDLRCLCGRLVGPDHPGGAAIVVVCSAGSGGCTRVCSLDIERGKRQLELRRDGERLTLRVKTGRALVERLAMDDTALATSLGGLLVEVDLAASSRCGSTAPAIGSGRRWPGSLRSCAHASAPC